MTKYIFDIETDGIKATKIHCLSYYNLNNSKIATLSDYELIKQFITQEDSLFIAHNGVRYDIPTIKRLLNIEQNIKIWDTLPLSWTLFPNRKKHGLDEWGTDVGVKKPEVLDWQNLDIEVYKYRCQEDVKINTIIWRKFYNYLKELYTTDEEIYRYLDYLSFKMDCVREQEEVGIKLDVEHCKKMLQQLTQEKENKITEIQAVMPKVAVKKKKVYENAGTDDKGNIFQQGDLFFNTVVTKPVEKIEQSKIIGWKEPNSNSYTQIKDWLNSLGWIPEHIKHVRDKKTNEVKKIPQISSKEGQGELCDSVKKLFEKEPKLQILDGYSVLSHRISIFEGFLESHENGILYPSCIGLTNTLRLQHKIVVNLPGAFKKYGKEIRSSLIAYDNHTLVGSDLSGVEDSTKRHYIYKYDPKYVEEMNTPGYDPHLEIAVLAGFITKEQAEEHKLYEKTKKLHEENPLIPIEGKSYKEIRQKAKTANFALTYKCGISTLARQTGLKEKEAKKLSEVYWKRNKAILDVENSLKVKQIGNQKWILNPISNFWYTLRAEKDKFSTLNQSTAVFVFDTWLKYIRQRGIKISYQCHDEWLANVKDQEKTKQIIEQSINEVNEELKLNVKISCSYEFANNYADCH